MRPPLPHESFDRLRRGEPPFAPVPLRPPGPETEYVLTASGREYLDLLKRLIRWDDLGMVQTSGPENDATDLAVMESLADTGQLPPFIEFPDVRLQINDSLRRLYEAGFSDNARLLRR